jgi:peptidoglycan/xylan/chitin deacetylase (PgdA/CDA1 family)
MNWQEIKEILSNDFEIGAHTCKHKILISGPKDFQAQEISKSVKDINNNLGKKCNFFAYPNGLYDNNSIELLLENYVEYAFTMTGGVNFPNENKLKIKRIGVNVSDSISIIILKLFLNVLKTKLKN